MNERKWHWWQSSLRNRLILSVIIMTFPLVGMLLYNNFYSIYVVRENVADSYRNLLNLYMDQIEAGLNDIDAYLNTAAFSDYSLVSLAQADTDTDYYSAKLYLYNKLSKDIVLHNSLNSFFVYQRDRQDFMDISKDNDLSFEEKENIQKQIIESIHSSQVSKGISEKRWKYFQIGQDYYLIDIVQTGNVYLGGWVKTDLLLKPLQSLQIGEGGTVLLVDEQWRLITRTDRIHENEIELHKKMKDYYIATPSKEFLVVGTPADREPFSLVTLIPNQHILANLPYLQGIIWIITVATFLFIPIGLYAMKRTILVPIHRVLRAMKKVREGDWSTRVVLNDASDELRLLGESFNTMMTEIERLRVNVYEEQLNKQREELQRLQLQVNPHFFLNSLNIVYNLAKVKNHELVLEMTITLIHYFRFMFRSNTSFVKLCDELEHTRNYLRIQSLRFPGQLVWSIEAPDYVTDALIPPLIIQSFVENSIKHAVTMDGPVSIFVQIDYLDEGSYSRLKISIKDTGTGFNDPVLKALQAGECLVNQRGEHTGIWNVVRRLRLLYGENAFIQYGNDEETGGAAITIILPTNPTMEENII
ncbi:sensor histidine kinase [Paenibacillus macerans]|uniref:sensor histidine kinase n=1 Tax=Paenibacillus macerans TaxID=44252 RepID=UPI00203F0B53|nr:histidine kinase [Paenibacillus macerans]MCM3703992.1 histidine kinase [Paenibacillus macerans]